MVKCNNCLERLKNARDRLAQRKDWEVKTKKGDREKIVDWESRINSTPSQCICDDFILPPQGLGGTEYSCDKCKQHVYLGHNEYGDCPPHVCEEHRCSQCSSTFIGNTCPTCKENSDKQQNERDRKMLEAEINQHQVMLKQFKAMKNTPGYSEHTVQQLEQQLAEMISRYKSKYGELPSSLREDVGGGVKTPPKMERVMFCGLF